MLKASEICQYAMCTCGNWHDSSWFPSDDRKGSRRTTGPHREAVHGLHWPHPMLNKAPGIFRCQCLWTRDFHFSVETGGGVRVSEIMHPMYLQTLGAKVTTCGIDIPHCSKPASHLHSSPGIVPIHPVQQQHKYISHGQILISMTLYSDTFTKTIGTEEICQILSCCTCSS